MIINTFTPQKQNFCANQAKAHKLVAANLGMVREISSRLSKVLPSGDSYQQGCVGLVQAANDFKRWNFPRYAKSIVLAEIIYGRSDFKLFCSPKTSSRVMERILKATNALVKTNGRPPTAEELAAKLGITLEKLSKSLKPDSGFIPIEDSLCKGKKRALMDFVTDEKASPTRPSELAERQKMLNNSLGILSKDESRILELHFGLGDNDEHTMKEIGDLFGVSAPRICTIIKKAIAKLKEVAGEQLADYRGM